MDDEQNDQELERLNARFHEGVQLCSEAEAEALYLESGDEDDGALWRQARACFREVWRGLAAKEGDAEMCLRSALLDLELTLKLEGMDEASAPMEGARQAAERCDHVMLKTHYHRDVAHVLFRQGRLADAIVSYRAAVVGYEELEDGWMQAQVRFELCDALYFKGDLESALEEEESARSGFEDEDDPHGVARCRRKRGDIFLLQRHPDKARVEFDAAERAFRELGAEEEVAETLIGQGDVLVHLGDLKGGLALKESALALYQQLGNLEGEAQAHRNRCEVLELQGRTQEALEANARAMELHVKTEEPLGQAHCLRLEGSLRSSMGELDQARELTEEALARYVQVEDPLGQAHCHLTLGTLMHRQGHSDRALAAFEQAQRCYERAQSPMGAAHCMLHRKLVWLGRGDEERALQEVNAALESYNDMDHQLGQANSYQDRGELHRLQDRFDESLADFSRALALYVQMRDRLGQANCWRNRAQVLIELKRFVEARLATTHALLLYRQIGDRIGESHALITWGEILMYDGDEREALKLFARARPIYERYGAHGVIDQILGRIYDERGQQARAIRHLTAACDALERFAQISGGLATRRLVLESSSGSLRRLMEALEASGQHGRALATLERTRGITLRLLARDRHRASQRSGGAPSNATWDEWLTLRAELRALFPDLSPTPSSAPPHADQALDDALERFWELDERMHGAPLPSLAQAGYHEVAPLLAGLTDDGAIVLVFHFMRSDLRLGAVLAAPTPHRGAPDVWSFAIDGVAEDAEDLEAPDVIDLGWRVEELIQLQLDRNPDKAAWNAALAALYDALFRTAISDTRTLAGDPPPKTPLNMEQALALVRRREGQRLKIVPSGLLHMVPFSALCQTKPSDKHRYLLQDHEVIQGPSLSILHDAEQRRAGDGPALVVSDPSRPMGGLDSLVGAVRESLATTALLQHHQREVTFAGQGERGFTPMTPDELMQRAGRFDYVHLACHATATVQDPWRSALFLSGAERDEASLSLARLSKMTLREGSVWILSACETARTWDLGRHFDDPLTPASLLLALGASRVLASLWSVNDTSTTELVSHTLTLAVRDNQPWGAALRQTQLDMLQRRLPNAAWDAHLTDQANSVFRSAGGGSNDAEGSGFSPNTTHADVLERGSYQAQDFSSPFYWAAFSLYGKAERDDERGQQRAGPLSETRP